MVPFVFSSRIEAELELAYGYARSSYATFDGHLFSDDVQRVELPPHSSDRKEVCRCVEAAQPLVCTALVGLRDFFEQFV